MDTTSYNQSEADKQASNYILVDGIPGWCDFTDFYLRLATWLPNNAEFCEVGTWLGSSAIFMATTLKNMGKNRVKVVCVDTWAGTPAEHGHIVASKGGSDGVYSEFVGNVMRANVGDMIAPVRMKSLDAAAIIRNRQLCAAFIDADHSYEAVRDDIRVWSEKVVRGGILCGHDWGFDSVKTAVKEFAAAKRIPIEESGSVWSCVLK